LKTTAHRLLAALARFVATCPLCSARIDPGQVLCATCATR
jgi:hypothetical protein